MARFILYITSSKHGLSVHNMSDKQTFWSGKISEWSGKSQGKVREFHSLESVRTLSFTGYDTS